MERAVDATIEASLGRAYPHARCAFAVLSSQSFFAPINYWSKLFSFGMAPWKTDYNMQKIPVELTVELASTSK